MKCPLCDEDLDVYDEEINLKNLWIELYTQCVGCGKAFKIDYDLKANEIKEID